MKKFIRIFLVLVVLLSLVGCGERLDTPTNVRITDDVLYWDQVQKATGYIVKVGEAEHSVTTTSFNLFNLNLAAGTYQVSVKAVGNDVKESRFSNTLSYVVGNKTLDKPTNLEITDGVLTWSSVPKASKYKVTINGVEFLTEELSVDLTDYVIVIGSYPVTVVAVGNGVNTFDSQVAQITLNFNQDLLTFKSNQIINFFLNPYGWEVGMDEDDFIDQYDYERYLDMVDEYQALVDTLVVSEIPFNALKRVMAIVEEYAENENPMEMVHAIVQSIDDLGLNTNQLAIFVLLSNKRFIEEEIENYERLSQDLEYSLEYYENLRDQSFRDMELAFEELQRVIDLADASLDELIQLAEDYFGELISGFEQTGQTDYDYYLYISLVDNVERLAHEQLYLTKELAKGEEADPWLVQMYQDSVAYYLEEIERYISYFDSPNSVTPVKDILIDKYTLIFAYLDNHSELSFTELYDFYNTYAKVRIRYLVDLKSYNEQVIMNEERRAYYEAQIQQLELMLVTYDHDNMKLLMKMSIEQALMLYQEVNWDIVEDFLEIVEGTAAPSPAVLAQVVQEVARLLRLATAVDQEEYVDLALEILLSVMPDISEDVQLAIRTLAAQNIPAIVDILITTIEKIDENVINKVFNLLTIDQEDLSKVPEGLEAYVNPDFVILVARLYQDVLADTVLSLMEELEKVYEMATQFYPDLLNFNLEEIKGMITSLNDEIGEIAGFEIIPEGYYEAEQVEKILEVMVAIEGIVSIFVG